MPHKELHIDMSHPRFRDPQQITDYMREEFAKRDRNLHLHDVTELIDDHDAGKRVLKVKSPTTRVFLGS